MTTILNDQAAIRKPLNDAAEAKERAEERAARTREDSIQSDYAKAQRLERWSGAAEAIGGRGIASWLKERADRIRTDAYEDGVFGSPIDTEVKSSDRVR